MTLKTKNKEKNPVRHVGTPQPSKYHREGISSLPNLKTVTQGKFYFFSGKSEY